MTLPHLNSLRSRLLALLVVVLTAVWLLMLGWIHGEASEQVNELMDAHLSKSARLIVGVFVHEAEEHEENQDLKAEELEEIQSFVHEYEQDLLFWVRDRRSQLLLYSGVEFAKATGAYNQQGFGDTRIDGREYRVFSISEPSTGISVLTAQPLHAREHLMGEIERGAFYGLIIGTLVLLFALWLGVGRGLQPLNRLSRQIASRSTEDRQAIDTQGLPEEVGPMIKALNALLEKLGRALDNERRFTADAAHELRTPLAALRVQAQVAVKTKDPAAREHAIGNITQGVDRTTHLVEQLLTLARVESDQQSMKAMAEQGSEQWLSNVLTDLRQQHGDAAKRIQVSGSPEEAGLHLNPVNLTAVIRNLLDNALRYAPENSSVQLSFQREGDAACIRVADHGPGIPESERARVMQRFTRGAKSGGIQGSGLGLSIVGRIVERHGGQLSLDWTETKSEGDTGPRGLTVRCLFST
ncbi:MAG: ATP-binding protein [Gammaproteobacteria bacterium]